MMILVIGQPGTGKSTAIGANEELGIKGLDPNSTFIIKPNNKSLPFPESESLYNIDKKNLLITRDMNKVGDFIKNINEKATHIKTIVVEDITHFFNAKERKDSSRSGFEKWAEMATQVYNMTVGLENEIRKDLTIIYIGHSSQQNEGSDLFSTVLQTPGKMLDNKVKLDSYFTYILHSFVQFEEGKIKYKFLTNHDGSGRLAKSSWGCLNLYENNDYGEIIDKIKKYHN